MKLLEKNPENRITLKEIKAHLWLAGVVFEDYSRRIVDAPLIMKGKNDYNSLSGYK